MPENSQVGIEELKAMLQNIDKEDILEMLTQNGAASPELIDFLKDNMDMSQKDKKDTSDEVDIFDIVKPFLNESQNDKLSKLMPLLMLMSKTLPNKNNISKEELKEEIKEELKEEIKEELKKEFKKEIKKEDMEQEKYSKEERHYRKHHSKK